MICSGESRALWPNWLCDSTSALCLSPPPDCDLEAVDLIRRLLCLYPEKRFTANRSLSHPYVRQFYTQRDVRWVSNSVLCFKCLRQGNVKKGCETRFSDISSNLLSYWLAEYQENAFSERFDHYRITAGLPRWSDYFLLILFLKFHNLARLLCNFCPISSWPSRTEQTVEQSNQG